MENNAIADLNKIIKRCQKLLEPAQELNTLPEYVYLWATANELRIWIPYDQLLIADLEMILTQEFGYQNTNKTWDSERGDRYINFKKNDIGLLVTMLADHKDAIKDGGIKMNYRSLQWGHDCPLSVEYGEIEVLDADNNVVEGKGWNEIAGITGQECLQELEKRYGKLERVSVNDPGKDAKDA